ncbi:hypothetical protein ACHABX_05900 [Nesterenkonia halotolerans]|uniref:hypothetical protein n=1 Tax=Nesterenkonia halotolerans TaxID=225325 RepID=UPI003EE6526C
MSILFGLLLVLAGAALLVWSAKVNIRANPGRRVPMVFGIAVRGSMTALLLQSLGVAVAGGSLYFWFQVVGTIGVVAVFIALIPWFFVVGRHNHQLKVRTRAHTTSSEAFRVSDGRINR